jgi:hypothetical protein
MFNPPLSRSFFTAMTAKELSLKQKREEAEKTEQELIAQIEAAGKARRETNDKRFEVSAVLSSLLMFL